MYIIQYQCISGVLDSKKLRGAFQRLEIGDILQFFPKIVEGHEHLCIALLSIRFLLTSITANIIQSNTSFFVFVCDVEQKHLC